MSLTSHICEDFIIDCILCCSK